MTASDERAVMTLRLQEMLSAAPGRRMSVREVKRVGGFSDSSLDEAIDLISTLADREGGSRAIAYRDGDDVVLEGSAAALMPVRLSFEEAMVLSCMLDSLGLERRASERIRSALSPLGASASPIRRIVSATTYGDFYQRLSEAARDGVRCRISYRSADERASRERLVDPTTIEIVEGIVYLIAWDVERDEQRRYRLDRVLAVRLTDDSVEDHPFRSQTPAQSLAASGETALISLPDAASAQDLGLTGLSEVRGDPAHPGRLTARVPAPSRRWLFDRVLASAGELRILEPRELIDAFIDYARGLVCDT